MIKNLYKIFADKWYHGGSIYFYSDPHFSDTSVYKLRFPSTFSLDAIKKKVLLQLLGPEKLDDFEAACTTELDNMQIDNINKVVTKNDTLIILGDVGNTDCVSKLQAGRKVLIMGNHDKGISNYFRIKSDGNDNHLFDEVYEGPLMISEKILLSHEPIALSFILNIHGHVHKKGYKSKGINCCAEHLDYKPICLTEIIKQGSLKKVKDIHRQTIDEAVENKNNKNI